MNRVCCLLFCLAVLPATVSCLLCSCQAVFGTIPCKYPNATCSTDGVCYALFQRIDPQDTDLQIIHDCYSREELVMSNALRKNICDGDINDENHIYKCCNTSYCNRGFVDDPFTSVSPTPTVTPSGRTDPNKHVYLGTIVGAPVACIVVIIAIPLIIVTLVCIRRRKKRIERTRRANEEDAKEISSLSCEMAPTFGLDEITDTSGSGFGMPHLEQRTIARSIRLGETIGTGRYGLVIVGDYQGEQVAVKKFASIDGQSWIRETEIYKTVLITHDNILMFIGSDMISNNGVTELWLVTKYHPHGSLYDYLNKKEVSPRVMLQMAISICSGLAHLHTELFGTISKPPIAHRDIKSKNILVKNDLRCCIADFGLAVLKANDTKVNMPTNPKQGTKRYMAPEILDETINMNYFESFKHTDIYAVGLVIWEICMRCGTPETALDYEAPFQGLVPSDPSFEDMKRVVLVEKRQPNIPAKWHQDELLRNMTNLMRECWHHRGEARPYAVYLKKKLNKLSKEDKLDYEKTIE